MNFFLFCCLVLNSNMQNITVSGLKEEYKIDDKINISLINNSDSIVFCTIGAEVNSSERWAEYLIDVNRPNSKSALLYRLEIRGKLKISFKAKQLYYAPNDKYDRRYRLRISSKTLISSSAENLHFSETFVIKK